MYRVPQLFSVNWGGLPPHLEHLRSPVAQKMIDNEQVNRENYLARKEIN